MNAIHVAWKDLQLLTKEKGQLVMLFLLPMVFILAFSMAYSAGQPEEEVIAVPVANEDAGGEMAGLLIDRLNGSGNVRMEALASEAEAEAKLKAEEITLALVIPAGFTEDVRAGTPAALRLVRGPAASDSEAAAVELVIRGAARDLALETQLLDGLGKMAAMMGGAPAEAQAFTADRVMAQARSQFERAKTAPLVAVAAKWPDAVTQGREDFSPSAFSMAGFAILFVFLTAQTAAQSIYEEKKTGTFRRLLAAPMSKGALLAGKMLPNFVTAVVQVAVIFGLSLVILPLLGIERPSLGHSPLGLVLLTVVLALCSTSLGVLIAALARTESQIGGISSVVLWVAGFMGGAFIPSFILGNLLGSVGKVVPHYWALQAYNDLMVRGLGLADILPELGVLAGFTAAFFAIGLLKFRFR